MDAEKLAPIQIGYGEQKIILQFQMISIEQQDGITNRFSDIDDKDSGKYQKQFDVCKDVLCSYIAAMPERIVQIDGESKRIPLVEDAGTPADAIRTFFVERTPKNERIIRQAYNLFQSQLNPDFHFLSLSGS